MATKKELSKTGSDLVYETSKPIPDDSPSPKWLQFLKISQPSKALAQSMETQLLL